MKLQVTLFGVLAAMLAVLIAASISQGKRIDALSPPPVIAPTPEKITEYVLVSPEPAAPDYDWQVLSGKLAATGQGLVVTLFDNGGGEGAEGVIHDSDLLMIVNELRDAGAEALSVNGQRLVATSEIRCAGAIVSVNNTRIAAPFEVCAVGPTEAMYAALNMQGGVGDTLKKWGFTLLLERRPELTIDAFDGEFSPKYARKGS
ncbi:hypothetical protein FACS1894217_08980 [Clostridia bacterium]|nr:hypothetical protein FACS1894217_08980 [Clostridia bacterium]